jgi:phage baseplate assembly protein gpV
MKTLPPGLLVVTAMLALTQLPVGAQETKAPDSVEKAFAKGGRIALDLSAGAYRIRGRMIDSVRLRWQTRDPRDMSSVRADVTVSGATARIRTQGPKNNFRVEIDVPQRVDLDIELTAGDLTVNGVEGNKTLSMWAGDVTIEVGSTDLYRRVDATVRAGEISATPFGRTSGGLFRSLHWTGRGPYILDAKLTAGDLKLVR